MRAIIPAMLLSILLMAQAEGQEPAKVKVASIRMNAVMQNGNLHAKIRLLELDQETLAAIKKVNAEIKTVQQEIVDAQNKEKLNVLQNKLQFLNKKIDLLTQRSTGRRTKKGFQTLLREFIVATYKDEYQLILQQDAGGHDPILWKRGVEITDVTDETVKKLRERLGEISTGSVGGPYLAPVPATAYPKARPAPPPQPAAKPSPSPAPPPAALN
jgi:hypothetical protein